MAVREDGAGRTRDGGRKENPWHIRRGEAEYVRSPAEWEPETKRENRGEDHHRNDWRDERPQDPGRRAGIRASQIVKRKQSEDAAMGPERNNFIERGQRFAHR